MLLLGIDLAWKEGSASKEANQTGVVALEPSGRIVDAGWTIGLEETAEWITTVAQHDTIAFIDAPLIVNNPPNTQRLCERQVGQRYMSPWKVGANSTNQASPNLGGVKLRERLEDLGWRYSDGVDGPESEGRSFSECYPYTAIVGVGSLGYDERPAYKRLSKKLSAAEGRKARAVVCDELINRLAGLEKSDPPLELRSHSETRLLIDEPSPEDPASYKQREDLLDAAICAWTASLWQSHGTNTCQVLGQEDTPDPQGRRATIIAPARPEQRGNPELSSD